LNLDIFVSTLWTVEDPIDSIDDLFRLGKIPIIGPEGGYWEEYLLNSALASERKAGRLGQTYSSVSEEAQLLEEKVYRAGSHVMLFYKQRIAVSVADNSAFNNQEPPIFHVSKATLRPHYHGWVYNKISAWREIIDNHLLRLHQSGIIHHHETKLLQAFEKVSAFNPEGDLEVLGPQHFILPSIFLVLGLIVAFITFIYERYK